VHDKFKNHNNIPDVVVKLHNTVAPMKPRHFLPVTFVFQLPTVSHGTCTSNFHKFLSLHSLPTRLWMQTTCQLCALFERVRIYL